MIRTLILFILIVGAALSCLAQNERPLLGNLTDLRGRTKFFLIANKDGNDVSKTLAKNDLKLVQVEKASDADFTIEYTFTVRELKHSEAYGQRFSVSRSGQLRVYFLENEKKVLVWFQSMGQGRTEQGHNLFPSKDLPKLFLSQLSAVIKADPRP